MITKVKKRDGKIDCMWLQHKPSDLKRKQFYWWKLIHKENVENSKFKNDKVAMSFLVCLIYWYHCVCETGDRYFWAFLLLFFWLFCWLISLFTFGLCGNPIFKFTWCLCMCTCDCLCVCNWPRVCDCLCVQLYWHWHAEINNLGFALFVFIWTRVKGVGKTPWI